MFLCSTDQDGEQADADNRSGTQMTTSDDDDDELGSIDGEGDDENSFEAYEDNFGVGVDKTLNENSDSSQTPLDPRICSVIES